MRKLNSELEPIGGDLFIGRFLEARRAAAAQARAGLDAPQAGAAGPGPDPPAPRAPAPHVGPPAMPVRRLEPEELTDTGSLQLEVEDFLNRDQLEGTNDAEVKEFLKERSGFDPSELE